MTTQDLFGAVPAAKAAKSSKAKALPKKAPPVHISSPLTAAQKSEATRNRNRFLAARNAWQLGDTRDADSACPECDGPRLAVLEERTVEGSQTWVTYCVNKVCVKCPEHGR
jgi:hypothetical protein